MQVHSIHNQATTSLHANRAPLPAQREEQAHVQAKPQTDPVTSAKQMKPQARTSSVEPVRLLDHLSRQGNVITQEKKPATTADPSHMPVPSPSAEAIAEVKDQLASKAQLTAADLSNALKKLDVSSNDDEIVKAVNNANDLKDMAAEHIKKRSAPETGLKQPYEITIDGLMAKWGQNDALYDLTGDGKVGVQDLLMLMSNGGTMQVESAGVVADQELTLDGLMAAWGASNSPYDLTGNGTVGIQDLLMFLSKHGSGEST